MPYLAERAKNFAEKCHEGQCRKYSGEPYITHPKRVAERLKNLGASETLIAAAYLHDVVEDCSIPIQTIFQQFGAGVASIVDEVTNRKEEGNRAARKQKDRERLMFASREAKFLKLIDRIDNIMEMLNETNTEELKGFAPVYAEESRLLAEVIGDADPVFKRELLDCAEALRSKYEKAK